MAEMPIVSVIVTVYNIKNYIDRCINSLLAQTYTSVEIIIVDDGSTDGSSELCDRLAEKDERIRVIHQPNGGLSNARNTGIDNATGQYIMFIDGDDVVYSDMCDLLLTGLQTYDAQIAACEVAHTFEGNAPDYVCNDKFELLNPSEAISQMWYQTGFFPSACTKMYSRQLFSQHRFTEGLLFEDVDIMYRLLWSSERIVCTSSRLYGYMHRCDSITTAKFTVRDLDILTIADRLLDFASNTAPHLIAAAQAYAVTAAMRVELNAPKTDEFTAAHKRARNTLKKFGFNVLKDKHTRKKTRYALILYYGCRPLMRAIYKRVDRWK